jgi:hypothetical protein
MRVWKLIPLFLIILGVVACSKPAEQPATDPATPPAETALNETSAPDPEPAPAVAPVPEPVPAPAPKPVKSNPKPVAATTPKTEAKPAPAPAPVNEPTPVAAVKDNTPAPAPVAPAPPPPPKPVIIPAGTELNVVLADPLNSGTNKAGDDFTANLAAPVYVNGATILERGAKLQGKVFAAEGSGRVSGKATMTIGLTGVTHRGKVVPISTKDLFTEAESSKGRDAAVVGGGAGVGAIIGAIAGGKKGAAIGAAVGGAGGTGAVLATKGKEVDFPAEFKLTFTLDKDLSVLP